jgi:toxin CcdB
MARFDVYINPSSEATTTPYLLDVQSNLLDGLDSRMVILGHVYFRPLLSLF